MIWEEAYLSVVEAGSKVGACRHHLLSQQSNLDAVVTVIPPQYPMNGASVIWKERQEARKGLTDRTTC